MNSIILKGNIARDVDIKSYNDVTIANTSIAVKDKYSKEEKTYFFNITAYRKIAELMGEYVAKGDPLLIRGRLINETYKTEAGENRTSTKIIVEEMEFLKTKKDKQAESSSQAENVQQEKDYMAGYEEGIREEDVPF